MYSSELWRRWHQHSKSRRFVGYIWGYTGLALVGRGLEMHKGRQTGHCAYVERNTINVSPGFPLSLPLLLPGFCLSGRRRKAARDLFVSAFCAQRDPEQLHCMVCSACCLGLAPLAAANQRTTQKRRKWQPTRQSNKPTS